MESIAGSPTRPVSSDAETRAINPPSTPSKLKRLSLVSERSTPRARDLGGSSRGSDENIGSGHLAEGAKVMGLQSPAEIASSRRDGTPAPMLFPRDRQRRTPRPLSLAASLTYNIGPSNTISSARAQPSASIQADMRSRNRLAHPPASAPSDVPALRGARPLSLRTSSELHGLVSARSGAASVFGDGPSSSARREMGPPRADVGPGGRSGVVGGRGDQGVTLMERYADLLRAIAHKEAAVDETRQELRKQEAELAALKSEWQAIASQQAGPSSVPHGTTPDNNAASARKGPPKPVFRAPSGTASAGPSSRTDSAMTSTQLGSLATLGGLGDTADQGKRIIGQLFDSLAGIQSPLGSTLDARTRDDAGVQAASADEAHSGDGRDPAVRQPGAIGDLFSGLGGSDTAWQAWDIVGSPNIQEVPKRASAFLSANLSETLNAIAHILPTPNLASLPEAKGTYQLTRPARTASAGTRSDARSVKGREAGAGSGQRPAQTRRQPSFLDDEPADDNWLPGSDNKHPLDPGNRLGLPLDGLQKPLTPVKRSVSPASSIASSGKEDGWNW